MKRYDSARHLREACLLCFPAGVSLCAFGQPEADSWLILANGANGSINAHTTREDLVRLYGAANVVDQDVDIGEGEMRPATFLFPEDSERRIEILWKDPDRRANPSSAEIRGKKSRWHGVHGISLGTTAMELQHINGRPFGFALVNDGTDMADQRISWHGARLRRTFKERARSVAWELGRQANRTEWAYGLQW